MEEVGEGEVVHDEVAGLCAHFEEEGAVADDVGVFKRFDVGEVLLEEEDVLAVEGDGLNCKPLPGQPLHTVPDHPMRPLADLLPHRVLILKHRMEALLLL